MRSADCSAARAIRSAIVFEPVERAAAVPAITSPPPRTRSGWRRFYAGRACRRDGVGSGRYAVALIAARGDLVASPRLAMKRVLSILPWKIGTPSSMHFEITSLRSRPVSRASSVGVRWFAIGAGSSLMWVCDCASSQYSACGGRPQAGRVANSLNGVRHVDVDVADPEAAGDEVA